MRITIASLICAALQASAAGAAPLVGGDWIVADPDTQAIVRVDGAGQTETITTDGHLEYPTGVAFDPLQAVVWVADPDAQSVIRVNAVTGSQQVVYAGAPLVYPTGVARAANGTDLLVVDPDAQLIWRVDPVLGTAAGELPLTSAPYPTGLVVMSNGKYGVSDPDAAAIYEVDPKSASAVPLAQAGELTAPHGITEETGSDDLLVAEGDRPGFLRVETASGTTTVEADGLGLSFPTGVAYVPEPTAGLQLLAGAGLLYVLSARRTRSA